MGKMLLLIYPTFSEFEIGVALSLVRRKYAVVTVGLTLQPVASEGGLNCLPDLAVDEADADDYDGIIIPGALDMIHCEGAQSLYNLVWALHEADKPIAAICGGPFVLGRAGVLDGHRYTAAFGPEQRAFLGLPEEGYVAEPVVRSGNLLTAQGSAFVEFGLALGDLLALYPDEADAAAAADFFHNRLAI
jgi:4-methyl-5(b-hydroxyethyl)-thiazole monophosphate biosynthesis